jgi:hypothetical protein
MTAHSLPAPRFVRKTQLAPGEYRKNFHQVDADVIAAVTSQEADRVTPLMSKIYLRLVSAPSEFWEREGVLYFAPRATDGRPVKSSKVLYEVLGVASATAHKALQWLHGQGIIGYFAGKNGAGIRIFLNRASSSIGVRDQVATKKILPFARGSKDVLRGSTVEPPFKDSFAVSDNLETDINPYAPNSGADIKVINQSPPPEQQLGSNVHNGNEKASDGFAPTSSEHQIAARLLRELEPAMRAAAIEAAAREHERTREWLESRGLPKAARVAQREAYNVLRQYGVVRATAPSTCVEAGRSDCITPAARALPEDEIAELAEACLTMLEVQGQALEATLAGMSVAVGGFLLPDDATRVRAKIATLLVA